MYLKEKYVREIAPKLQDNLGLSNKMQIPKIEKVVLNMGIGTYIKTGNKDFSSLKHDLALIAGQEPSVRFAKKAISNFKLRQGMPVGLSVTLRGEHMYAFLERLIDIVLPRVKDFRWINKKSFDAQWNFNFGIKEHTIFPEVPQLDVVKYHWLQITIKTNSPWTEATRMLLTEMGFPFSK